MAILRNQRTAAHEQCREKFAGKRDNKSASAKRQNEAARKRAQLRTAAKISGASPSKVIARRQRFIEDEMQDS